MRQLTAFETSRYYNQPKLYIEGRGFMALPFCPDFEETTTYVTSSTDTVVGLAQEFYGDSRYMWAIIIANDLSFPPKLTAGMVLEIPSFEEVVQM